MKVLITGATGFIGKRLVKEMRRRNYDVSCFVRKTSDIDFLKKLGVKFSYGNVLDRKSIERALDDNEIIIHLVGIQSFSEFSKRLYKDLYETNVFGLKNLLDAIVAKKKRLKKIVFLSSTAAVGLTKGKVDEKVSCKPISPYQKTKYEGERLCLSYVKRYKLPIVILRPSMVYGTRDDHSQIQKMVNFIKKGFFPIIGDGRNNVPMIYISDAVGGIIKGALKGRPGNTYFITNDKKITMSELVDTIGERLNVKVIKIKIPVFIAYMGAGMIELLCKLIGKNFTVSRRRILLMSSDRVFDTAKARRELGFVSKLDGKEGIARAIREYGV